MDLDGRSMFITGAGSGIGLATAASARARGARVAGTVRGAAQRRALARHAASEAIFDTDVTDAAAMDRAVADAIGLFGRLDAAVACAGVIELLASTETTDEVWAAQQRAVHAALGRDRRGRAVAGEGIQERDGDALRRGRGHRRYRFRNLALPVDGNRRREVTAAGQPADGARSGTRTRTPLRERDFESYEPTNTFISLNHSLC